MPFSVKDYMSRQYGGSSPRGPSAGWYGSGFQPNSLVNFGRPAAGGTGLPPTVMDFWKRTLPESAVQNLSGSMDSVGTYGDFGGFGGAGSIPVGDFTPGAAAGGGYPINFGLPEYDFFGGGSTPGGSIADTMDMVAKTSGSTPGVGDPKGFGGGMFSGMDPYQKVMGILGGLQAIGGLYMGMKQLGLAKRAQRFQEDFATANLNNQVSEYNRRIGDIGRTRSAVEGTDQTAWMDQNRLRNYGT